METECAVAMELQQELLQAQISSVRPEVRHITAPGAHAACQQMQELDVFDQQAVSASLDEQAQLSEASLQTPAATLEVRFAKAHSASLSALLVVSDNPTGVCKQARVKASTDGAELGLMAREPSNPCCTFPAPARAHSPGFCNPVGPAVMLTSGLMILQVTGC